MDRHPTFSVDRHQFDFGKARDDDTRSYCTSQRAPPPRLNELTADEWGDAKNKDGRSLNVSKQDIADILECDEGMVSVYLSLPRYNVRQRRQPDQKQLVTKDMVEDMIAGVYTSQKRMMEDTNGRQDGIYYPIDSSIGWKI
ncbi:hypothetical protein F2Q70_00027140 [Brassica cretica]|uniref:Uncharacterized protein n=1 Tax=Brassica cretica TaxID=69181 RepID=A0A8S9L837_BRACR|nr:hypothetical protein F2Q70_00027140 [Brassica cretica]